ncbi:MAG: hypothetical protein GY842_19870, partial [bacterium]|nr:hypothetical protein [bacterium]
MMVDLTSLGDAAADTPEYLYYLKDMLGSVTALADTNGAERMQAASSLGASCVYNPYGETIVQQTSFYHDADLDGDIDAAAEADLEECADDRPTDPVCVFVHDRNGDQTVDVVDLGLFAGFSGFDSNGTTPPADFERTHGPWFDANGDGELDVF